MAISKKIRFEVFKRDGFKCQYCGKTPPEVTLEIDHIKPKYKKGSDDINNLITACFDCNRGKKHIELDRLPNTLINNIEIIKEKELQYKEYQKILAKINKRIELEILQVEEVYTNNFPRYGFSETFKISSVKKFINTIGLRETLDSMYIACAKINDCNKVLKYFCGICWNKIKNTNDGL